MPFPTVDCERLHPSLPVIDVPAAVQFYTTRLGFRPGFTWPETGTPTMAGVNYDSHASYRFVEQPPSES
jgi:catechol 2,3-dioxygenase-like lactoylglutathione lyase family enzyme